ncbi:hypothetical protein Val02_65240 [Virgisporangium aliadipatigenens]|uniref:Uncharacterized protein n=1 Tax=Virgisporangium aliadipatigenens TaxID=741659 RepID=A0A8J3YSJ3_9ACTN|nr:hypothetical protein [Virgisporangium aliadipatigenens]GIJ49638.1 hypothetical protein Val02_65240 [Virgisporangium aliadipatigenens]
MVDPRPPRPGRGWYVLAAAIAAVGVLTAPLLVVLGVASFGSVGGTLPSVGARFHGGDETTVELTKDRAATVYAVFPQDSDGIARATCEVSGAGEAALTERSYGLSATIEDTTWVVLYDITVDRSGRYTLSCTSDCDRPGTDLYAVGDAFEAGGMAAAILGGATAFFGALLVPCFALIVAGIMAIVTAVRRRSPGQGTP